LKRKIEIITAGCPVCEPTVELIRNLAIDKDEVILYDLSVESELESNKLIIHKYQIKQLPSVLIDGKLLPCFNNKIDWEDLMQAVSR